MNYLIDFSLFYYKCGDLYKDTELKFSYYTDLDISNLQDIIRQMINMFTDICNQLNYFDKLTEKEHNFHSLEIQHKKNIGLLYEASQTQEWIQQHILDCDFIYQRNIKDNKRRIFFILDREQKIIKPLILDLNHLIYNDKKYL